MSAQWETKKLGDVLELVYGKPLPKEDRCENGQYCAYGANGVKCRTNKYYSDEPSIIVGRKGSAGETTLVNEPFWPLDVTFFVKYDRKKYDLKFLFLCLKSLNLPKMARGVKPGINRNDVYAITFSFPPLPEQKRIVAILDKAFEGIDTAIANTEKNLVNARELFESYRASTFKNNSSKWPAHKLGDLTVVQSGGTPLKSVKEYWVDGNIPWYSSGELNDLYTVSPDKMITQQGLKNSNAKIFPVGSLLIGMYDTAALKMSILDREATFNQAVAGVMPKSNINIAFIMHAINATKAEILSRRRGVRQKNLSLGKIKDIDIPLPALEQQDAIVKELLSISDETHRLESVYRQKFNALSELKQSILNKAFSGELTTIKEDELRTEEVA